MESKTLWQRIHESPNALEKFGNKACIYPEPYQDNPEVVIWFYCPSSGCRVFAGVPKAAAQLIEESDYWGDYEFSCYVEEELMPFCADNTEWGGDCGECRKCIAEQDRCIESPFEDGSGYSYGIAEENEFVLEEVRPPPKL